ncbi:MAG: hypothetical protein ACREKH_15590 [Candidatus Rokuibacteriota bacterium]
MSGESGELDVRGGIAAGLKAQILAADDRPFTDEDVPEWGVKLRVRGLSGTERDAYEAKAVALKQGGQDIELRLANFRSRLLVKCLFDPETDERIFEDNEVNALGGKAGNVIDRLFDVAQAMSGMDSGAAARAEGNSESDPSDSSTID